MVILSNGFDKFYLATAAAELQRYGMLSLLITGAYPGPAIRRAAGAIAGIAPRKIARLCARSEDLPDGMVQAQWLPEAAYKISGAVCGRAVPRHLHPALMAGCLDWYGRRASRYLRRAPGARVYHFRAGYGRSSVAAAKRAGMVALCDHSLVHPAVLSYLVENGGRLPRARYSRTLDAFWSAVARDIEQADAVVVNSDFVKETLVRQGIVAARVHVVYWGVDDRFREAVPARRVTSAAVSAAEPLRLLFAGHFERRKGADVLVRALEGCEDFPWRLTLAGTLSPPSRREHQRFLDGSRVTMAGPLLRQELAKAMAETDVFVFPSLAEGSARVVFEALACGCYVITTPNSGSIVADGVHGRLVAPGDARALAAAMREAASRRAEIGAAGLRNAALIDSRYRQYHYGQALLALYERLLATAPELAQGADEARLASWARP